MRDNILVNPSGIPGHAMGIDLNIEHLIGYLKVSGQNLAQCNGNAFFRHYLQPKEFIPTGIDSGILLREFTTSR
jgi:hypothetical protein